MRHIAGAMLAALTLLPLSTTAQAQGLGLMASPAQCAALESLVVYGLIDGGEAGDTTELTGVVNAGDAAVCQSWLDDYGYGAGFADEDCTTAWDILARNGLPVELEPEIPTYIATILAPASAQDCDDMLFDLSAGQ